jgi:hypothetical protein
LSHVPLLKLLLFDTRKLLQKLKTCQRLSQPTRGFGKEKLKSKALILWSPAGHLPDILLCLHSFNPYRREDRET